ncbi:hypothetical protein FTO70_11080 [Methanosarcina sp. KYL-1]|nr:hypothetical protein [Methanosarcina sp. KYL-1]
MLYTTEIMLKMFLKFVLSVALCVSVVFFLFLLFSGPCSGATLNVSGEGSPAGYTSIQEALNDSGPGDTVLVHSGVYAENLRVSTSNLTLGVPGNETVILKALNPEFPLIVVDADNVTISGFSLNGTGGWGTGLVLEGRKGLILANNYIEASYLGIALKRGERCLLENNSVSGADYGILLEASCNDTLAGNTVTGCSEALALKNSCSGNTLSGNSFSDNFRGIYLGYFCSNNLLESNALLNNSLGISLEDSCSGNIIKNNTVQGNAGTVQGIIRESQYRESQYGFYLDNSCSGNTLGWNNVSGNRYAFYLKASCKNNFLHNNSAADNLYGFYLGYSCDGNTLSGNSVSSGIRGIRVETACSNNTVQENRITGQTFEGICLVNSSENLIAGNDASENSEGMELEASCSNNTLTGNNLSGNARGLLLRFSGSNLLKANNVSFNGKGILFSASGENVLCDSSVTGNSEFGLSFEASENNTVYNNLFNNTLNALDASLPAGSGNIWNVSSSPGPNIYGGPYIGGNYWSDYEGNDSNGDGFGDEPYVSGNISDALPLFRDLVPPVISILSPTERTYPGSSVPLYASSNEVISSWWYTLNGDESLNFSESLKYSAEALLALPDGSYTLRVYGTDLSGNVNSSTVGFSVDSGISPADRSAPLISILTPEENRTYTGSSLFLYAHANESLSEWWYTLDGSGVLGFDQNSSFTAETLLELSAGPHSVRVYGFDLAGNLNSTAVNFTVSEGVPQDGVPPLLSILSPRNMSYSVPAVPLYASSNERLSRWWYTLNDSGIFEFSSSTEFTAEGPLQPGNGVFCLEVYGLDPAGNLNSTAVAFKVEVEDPQVSDPLPLISINSPENRTYPASLVELNASSNEPVLDWWYVLDGSSARPFNESRESASRSFLNVSDGQHRVAVYGLDLAGQLNFSEVSFRMDSIPPVFSILSPENNRTYLISGLTLYVSADEKVRNWSYRLDGEGPFNFSENTEFTAETFLSLPEGGHLVEVSGFDLAGNPNSTTVNFSVQAAVPEDTILPVIAIMSPESRAYAASTIPLEAGADECISKWWYTLDNSSAMYFSEIGEFEARDILELPDGAHRVKAYGIDLSGNVNSSLVGFGVDTLPPMLSIVSPENGSRYETESSELNWTSVDLEIRINEPGFIWYRLDNGSNSTPAGLMELKESLSLEIGLHNITFFAEDLAGNLNSSASSVNVSKKAEDGDIGPGSAGSGDGGLPAYYKLKRLKEKLEQSIVLEPAVHGPDESLSPQGREAGSVFVPESEDSASKGILGWLGSGLLYSLLALLLALFFLFIFYVRRDMER